MPSSPLLDHVRTVARLKHLSLRTETAYLHHIKRFILYHHKRHPSTMGESEIRAYLAHLAVDQQVAASTQNVALCALLFLYREVLRMELPYVSDIERARRPARIPVVFTRDEVQAILANLHGEYHVMASLQNEPSFVLRTNVLVPSMDNVSSRCLTLLSPNSRRYR